VARKVDVDQLVDAAEIADRLGVSGRQVVQNWMHRYDDFPEPVVRRTRAVLWYWPDVKKWIHQTGRDSNTEK
jgi:predicted DNA-binding transcriptional regulator AlpA